MQVQYKQSLTFNLVSLIHLYLQSSGHCFHYTVKKMMFPINMKDPYDLPLKIMGDSLFLIIF
jgi:hypothetical protein